MSWTLIDTYALPVIEGDEDVSDLRPPSPSMNSDGEYDGRNFIAAPRKLVAFARNKVFYEE